MKEVAIPRQVGIYIREERTGQRLTQRELARKAGVSERLVLSLELGDATGIRLDKLMAVLHALGMGLFVSQPATATKESAQNTPTDITTGTANRAQSELRDSSGNAIEETTGCITPKGPQEASLQHYWDLYNQIVHETSEEKTAEESDEGDQP